MSRGPILAHLPLSGFLGSLLCDLIAPTPGLAISFLMPRTLAEASSLSSGRAYLFLNFLPPLCLRSISALIVWGSVSLLTTPPRSLFLVCMAPIHSSPTNGRTDSFFSSILPSPRNLFILGDFNCHHPLWDSRGTSNPRWEEEIDWVISSDLFPLSDPDTPTLLHRSSGSRSSPDISFANSSLAFSCLLEVLQNLGSDHLPILLSVPPCPFYRPNKPPLPSIFRKLVGMAFLSTLALTVLLQRNTHLFLFPLQLRLSFSLWF